jgi:hypothetical protein
MPKKRLCAEQIVTLQQEIEVSIGQEWSVRITCPITPIGAIAELGRQLRFRLVNALSQNRLPDSCRFALKCRVREIRFRHGWVGLDGMHRARIMEQAAQLTPEPLPRPLDQGALMQYSLPRRHKIFIRPGATRIYPVNCIAASCATSMM